MAVWAAPLVAQSNYDAQREIQHRRDFEAELDSLRSRPNTPSSPSGVDEEGMKRWLEGKKAAQDAWRGELGARAARAKAAEEEKQRRDVQRDAERASADDKRARFQMVAERTKKVWIQAGFEATDADLIAFYVTPKEDGSYNGEPYYLRRAAVSREALAAFNAEVDTAIYARLTALATLVRYGGEKHPGLYEKEIGAFTYLQCMDRLLDRFQTKAVASLLAADTAVMLAGPEHFHNSYYAKRPELIALMVKASKLAPERSLATGEIVVTGSPRWGIPGDPVAAVPLLEAGYAYCWSQADSQTKLAAGKAEVDEAANRNFRNACHRASLQLARIHETRTDLAGAAKWYARNLTTGRWRVKGEGQIDASNFFEAKPDAIDQLELADFTGLAGSVTWLYSPVMVQAITRRAERDFRDNPAERGLWQAARVQYGVDRRRARRPHRPHFRKAPRPRRARCPPAGRRSRASLSGRAGAAVRVAGSKR